jgi:immunoglobulin-like protein involved in spore germination/sporulation and spore germination protein
MAAPQSSPGRQTPRPSGSGMPSIWLVVVSAVAAGLLLGLAIGMLGRDGDGDTLGETSGTPGATGQPSTPAAAPSDSPPATTEPTTTPPATPTSDREQRTLALYYLRGGANSDARLFREFRTIEVVGRRPVLAAITAMFTVRPLDRDYENPWPASSRVLSTSKSGDLVTVNLSRSVAGRSASELVSRMAIQQLVYTATAADLSTRRVNILVEGKLRTSLWGHPVAPQPIARAPEADVLAPVWITDPIEGATVGRTVTVKGTADVFEATVSYEVTDLDGTTVQEGSVQASAGSGTRGAWSKKLTFEPGTYVLRFFYRSADDGSVQGLDTKTIRIR